MKSNMVLRINVVPVFILAFAMIIGIGVHSSQAADTIKLTYGGLYSPSHPFSKAVALWVDKIEKETQGRVKIKVFWAGALYGPRESALELSKGVADIGDFSGAYAPMGFDFEKSMRMAMWGVNDRMVARKVYKAVFDKFPQLEEEFTNAGIKVMAYASIPPYQLLLAKKKVSNVGDFKGLTIKASGDMGKLISELGGQGVVISMGDTYTAMQKTTIDGALAPYETLRSFRFSEVAKYALELNILAAPAGHWGFCMKSFNKLPPEIQKVFENNVDWFGNKVEELVYNSEEEVIKENKNKTVSFISLPPKDLDIVYQKADQTILKQMKRVDEKGLPGTEVYKEMRRLIDEYSK